MHQPARAAVRRSAVQWGEQLTTAGVSNYNGMVVSFQHRFVGWSQGIVQANYTYGHAFDESQTVACINLPPGVSGAAGSEQHPGQLRSGGV